MQSFARPRDRIRLGLFQHVPRKWALEENFAAFLRGLERASAQGVELLVAPEAFLDGYAAADPQSTRQRLFDEVAQEVGGSPYLARVAQEARDRQMSLAFGFTQKEGTRLFNAAGLWDSQGDLVGIYHKTHLQDHDQQFDPGESLPVFPSPWGPLGLMICADRRWPETPRMLRLQGARLILTPSYGMCHEFNEWMMRIRAYENDCFIAFCHPRVGFVVGPAGNLLGKLEGQGGEVLMVEVDLSQAPWGGGGHLRDRRPELYGLLGHKEPR